MKKKSIIISIIVILILIVVGLFIINLPKEQPIEPMPTVELIEEETIVEETNTDKSDPSIPTFNAKQGTVEGYEATETEETEETEAESYEMDSSLYIEEITEPEPQNDGLDDVRKDYYDMYQDGIMTAEEYERAINALNNVDKVEKDFQEIGQRVYEEWAAEHRNPALDREPPKIGSGKVSTVNETTGPAKLNDNPALSGYRTN